MAECRRMFEKILSSIIDYSILKAGEALYTHECRAHGDIGACEARAEAESLSRRALGDLLVELERFKAKCLVGE
jgi:hypothetical protein